MVTRTRGVRALAAVTLAVVVGLALPGTGTSVPPPPDNPSDSDIQAGRDAARRGAGEVGELANRLAEADARLTELQAQVETKLEDANKARVDLQRAERAQQRAQQAAQAAAVDASAASQQVDRQRGRLDEFVAASYRQGSKVGSVTAFIGSTGPQDVLERASLLDAISRRQLDVLDDLQRARVDKANKDSLARKAVADAEATRRAADRARDAAEAAQQEAIAARSDEQARSQRLEADKADAETRLAAARSRVSGLQSQRERYETWLAAKRREDQAAAAASRPAPAAGAASAPAPQDDSEPPGDAAVEVVIARALSQVGLPYAWGGGDASGPTRGIRDGGVADAHGDFRKVGFDCSGLMIYAFAGAGIELDHYSGYQYQAGRKVPLSQMRRGDMLFWQDGGSTHHVALYLGGGRMVEAPYSGSQVRVTSVRYGGIAPYAIRLF